MKSATVATWEIDNIEKAVEELKSALSSKLELQKSSLGMVYCDADVDVAQLGEKLSSALAIEIVGLTTTATIERWDGYNDMGIVLTVITDDNLKFAIGDTGDLQDDQYEEQITTAYKAAESILGERPKLILQFAPYITSITSENYVEIMDRLSDNAPIFGGVSTDHYDLQYQKTFRGKKVYERSLIFILLGGSVRPVFSIHHSFTSRTKRKGVITKSNGNIVERVDNQTFKEFIADFGPVPTEEEVIFRFQSTPFVLELPDYSPDEQPVVRVLCTMDHVNETGGFLSKMPEGSSLSIGVLQKDNLRESCQMALDGLSEKIKNNKDYSYSLILISTCNARHLLMGDAKNLESNILSDTLSGLPESINAFGFYGFGEMCPTSIGADGKAVNRFHNCSFVVCAI